MTRPARGQRALVLAPLPSRCPVCHDDRRVGVVALDGMRGAGAVRCPHCSAAPDLPIPIFVYPFRDDQPRGAA